MRAVLGIDDGRQVEATAAAEDVVETVDEVETELVLETEELDAEELAESEADEDAEDDETVEDEESEEEAEDEDVEDDDDEPVWALALLLALIALKTEESIQLVLETATEGYTVL
jgi:hypothetical protein